MPGASTAAVLLSVALTTSAGPAPLLRIQDPALLESSGLSASLRHDGVLWTHADGGEVAQVRAVGGDGETVATVTLRGIDPYDPEALAPGVDPRGRPALFLGDIGDNRTARPDVSVFRITEPRQLRDATVDATWFRFVYPDGPHDAEALLVEPRTGRIMVVTKVFGVGGVYLAPERLVTADEGSNRLVRVADAPPLVTDGAYLPDGRFVLRTYTSVQVFDGPGHEVASAALPVQPQGESLAVRDGMLLVGSEGARSAVYEVPVPGAVVTPEAAAASEAGGAGRVTTAASEDRWRQAALVARALAIIVVLVALVVLLRRGGRNRRR